MTTSPREALERLTRALSVQPDAPDERMFGVSAGDMRALLSLLEWRPISEAPKDGTEVLLFCVPNEVPSLRPHIAPGYWRESKGLMAPGLWLLRQAVGPSYKPTHFLPLPAAPTEDQP